MQKLIIYFLQLYSLQKQISIFTLWNSDKIFLKPVVEGVRLDLLVVNYSSSLDYKLIIPLWLVTALVFERRNEINAVLMIVTKENISGTLGCSWGKRGYPLFSRGYYLEKVKIITKNNWRDKNAPFDWKSDGLIKA